MLNIAGYQIIATLYQGCHSIIYRGVKAEDTQQSVIIKAPATISPSKPQIDKLRQEFELRQRITSTHVVKFLELKPDITYGYLLIEEDDHADTLINHFPKTGFAPLLFLNIAIQLAEGLRDIHHSHVIHKDIKLHNIIYQADTGKVKYIDFNSASLLQQHLQASTTPISTTEATLAYISPEQTGRINRMVDYRSDLYSLGVTFFQLLCGKLPFQAKNAAELVHCHLAKQPLSPHILNPSIPKPLSDIIIKLLQKDADNRYQSAYGLLVDLKRCHENLMQKGEIVPFTLAEQDVSEYFYIPQRLYGREAEFAVLSQCFEHIKLDRAEIVMITGPAGSGKSALVQEMQPNIVVQQGYFLMGKFEFLKRHMAYSAIAQMILKWIIQILALSEEEITNWKTQLLAALNEQGQLLIDVIPDLELILGKQPALPILDPEQTKNRFHWIFQQFITVLAQPTHPLVMFLDDWQWADAASLELLEAIMTNPDTKSLLLIGAYRNAEVDAFHPALMVLEAIQKAGITIQTLSLSPLNIIAINQWLAEATHQTIETTLPLTTLLYHKTEGLPFFIKIFLLTLYEQGLLTLVENRWQWDLEKIYQLPATENVINFVIQQMQRLPSATQDILHWASCLGHRFTFKDLQLVTQKPTEQLETELQLLVNNQLLLLSGIEFQFAHDRIQEATYQQISIERRMILHLTIGRLLQVNLSADAALEQLMIIVNHLNRSKSLITELDEQISLIKFNWEISKKLKKIAAYRAALDYLQIAKDLLENSKNWKEHYDLTYSVYYALVEMEYLNGNFEQSEALAKLLLKHVQTAIEQTEIYELLIIQKTLTTNYQEAIQFGYIALNLLKIHLPTATDLTHIAEEGFTNIKDKLKNKAINSLLNASEIKFPEQKAALKLLYRLTAATFIYNRLLFSIITTTMVEIALQYGYTPEICLAYANYGTLLCCRGDYRLGYEFGTLAIQLSDKLSNLNLRCITRFFFICFIHPWSKPLKEAVLISDEAYRAGIESGELQYAGYHLNCKPINLFWQGYSLKDISIGIANALKFNIKTRNQMSIDIITAIQLAVSNLLGQTTSQTDFYYMNIQDSEYQQNWQTQKNFIATCQYQNFKAYILYLYGYTKEAYEAIQLAEKSLDSISGNITVALCNWYYSLILINLYSTVDINTQRNYWQRLETNQAQMKIWADHCSENFLHKYLLVAAEMAQISDKRWEAVEMYNQAIELAKEQGFIQEQALASELAGKFWLAQNKSSYAQGLLQAAYQLYERWGAKHKVDQLRLKYGGLLTSLATTQLSGFNVSGEEETISANSLRLLDLTSIVKTSQSISSEVDLAKLLLKIMHLLIENAGAQTGAFLVEESGTLFVQAEYMQEGQIRTLQQLPLSQWKSGSHTIIEYVKRTKQPILLGNASTDTQFGQDPYVMTHHLQSVLCLPVIRHRQLKGILYLENNLAAHMFTEQHLQILTILASQIAISLENSIFYESIRSVTERLNLALQSGNVGTWSWNIQANKIVWDPYMCALHGIKPEDFDQTYEGAMTLVHPEDFSAVEQAVKRSFESEVPYSIEYRIIRQDDKSVHIMAAQGKVYHDEKGQVEKLLGIVWDITERKRLEEDRLQALKQAEEKERRRAEEAEKYRRDLEDFINMICHEIRNPMSGIYGNIDFLQQAITSLRPFHEDLFYERRSAYNEWLRKLEESTQEIQQCAKHQKAIIDDVLDLSKIEAGKVEFKQEPFCLKSLVEETAQIFDAPLKQKKLRLRKVLPDGDPWVKGDINRIKMALINFMANALKFTERGEIKISLQIINVSPTHITFTLSVEDTGIGMSAKEQSQLFQPFARVASAEYEGSGLGLLISKRFIQQMGGQIDVKSEKGKGSQFTIQLTCETAPAEIKSVFLTAQAAPPTLPIAKRILIVEDNAVNQRILRRQLEAAGYGCEVANNGQEAIDKWATGSFDFIFMDLEMPVMNGFDATKAIRERERQFNITRKIPIVALSAYASKEFVQQAHSVGMDDYITKPHEKSKLLEAIQKWTLAQPEPSPAVPSADTALALNLVQHLLTLQPAAPASTEPISPTTSSSAFWRAPQPTPTKPTESMELARTWMPAARRNKLYPVLDRLSDAFTSLKISIIKLEAKYQAKASPTGWQLFCLKGTEECLAVLNIEQETQVDHLLETIQRTDTTLQAKKMRSGSTHSLAIHFTQDNALITSIEALISNIQAQRILPPTSH